MKEDEIYIIFAVENEQVTTNKFLNRIIQEVYCVAIS
jgi:hypothetical protein